MYSGESPLGATAKGAISGLAGTAVLTLIMSQMPKIMEQLGMTGSEPPSRQSSSDGEQPKGEPTEVLAEKVSEGVFEKPIDEGTRQTAGQAIHWAYGTGWGAFYGIAQSSLLLPHLLHGTVFGGLLAVIATTLVPVMRMAPPLTGQPASKNIMQAVFIFVYAWITALVFHFLTRKSRR